MQQRLRHDVRLRAAVQEIYEAVYPGQERTPVAFDEAERLQTIHYRQAVEAAAESAAHPHRSRRAIGADLMGQRRKGEKPVPKQLVGWSDDHPVAGCMRRGSKWFDAWIGQMTTPYHRLSKRTKLSVDRIREIDAGSTITRAELEALAKAWWITPDGLLASMPDPSIMTD